MLTAAADKEKENQKEDGHDLSRNAGAHQFVPVLAAEIAAAEHRKNAGAEHKEDRRQRDADERGEDGLQECHGAPPIITG
jgi:hypothetical protein